MKTTEQSKRKLKILEGQKKKKGINISQKRFEKIEKKCNKQKHIQRN